MTDETAYEWWAKQDTQLLGLGEMMGDDTPEPAVDQGGQLLEMIEDGRVASMVDDDELITTLAGLGVPIEQTADALDMSETEVEALAETRAITMTERLDAIDDGRQSRL